LPRAGRLRRDGVPARRRPRAGRCVRDQQPDDHRCDGVPRPARPVGSGRRRHRRFRLHPVGRSDPPHADDRGAADVRSRPPSRAVADQARRIAGRRTRASGAAHLAASARQFDALTGIDNVTSRSENPFSTFQAGQTATRRLRAPRDRRVRKERSMQEHPAHSRPARAGLPVNRRTLLGTAGAAALSAAAPGFASAKGQAAAPRPAISVDPSRLPLIGDAEFPIGLWWPPPPFQTTQERYQEIADAGFTFIITGNYLFADAHIQRYAMQMAEAAGIKVVADDDTMRWITHEFEVDDDGGQFTLTSAEARSKISAVLNQYGSSSFVGIDHYDEPAPDKFATLAQTVQINRELSPETLPYINLFPTTDPAYVRQFVDVVKPSLISFDRYPLLLDGDDADFFLNWKIIRDEGLRADLPTWCFIQTLAY